MSKITQKEQLEIKAGETLIKVKNMILRGAHYLLFRKSTPQPKNIVIYKVGNIGDIVCAVPAMIAIRKSYSKARITLLTSPGEKGRPGAHELLRGARYLDNMIVYYHDDVHVRQRRKIFMKRLKSERFDVLIQLPDDLAGFKILLRNMFFAKAIGVRSAYGFMVRTVQLFKRSQVRHMMQKTETESLLDMLNTYGISTEKPQFEFPITAEQKKRVQEIIKKNNAAHKLLVAVSPGGKRASNRWSIDRFAAVAAYLEKRYGATIVVFGGKEDKMKAEIICKSLPRTRCLVVAGGVDILETMELLKYCKFVVANSTGIIHLAAAVGTPAVGIYGVRDVPGRWFPYGNQHKVLYHSVLDCDYRKEACIQESIEIVSLEEVRKACDEMAKILKIRYK